MLRCQCDIKNDRRQVKNFFTELDLSSRLFIQTQSRAECMIIKSLNICDKLISHRNDQEGLKINETDLLQRHFQNFNLPPKRRD